MDDLEMPTLYELYKEAFLKTGDAHHVWEAIRFITKSNGEFPDWIREYLGQASTQMMTLDSTGKDFPGEIVDLLRLKQNKPPEALNDDTTQLEFYRNNTTDHNAKWAYILTVEAEESPPDYLLKHIASIVRRQAEAYEAEHPTWNKNDVEMAKLMEEVAEADYGKKRIVLKKYAAKMGIEVPPNNDYRKPCDILEERLKRFRKKIKLRLNGGG